MLKIIIILLFICLSFFAFKVDGKQEEVCLKKSYELYKENFMSSIKMAIPPINSFESFKLPSAL